MDFGPDQSETMARARADLRLGLPLVLTDGRAAVLAAAVESLGALRLAAMRRLGPLTLALTARRAETLKARAYDGDIARLKVPDGAGADWLRGLADPATDLTHPLLGPFATRRDEPGAGLDRLALLLVKSARLLPAAVTVAVAEPAALASREGLVALDIAALPLLSAAPRLLEVAGAHVPLALAGAARLHLFRAMDGDEEHVAAEVGQPDRDLPVLVRLHSACFTGDVLGSAKCDCGAQLQAALARMGQEGTGLLLYLDQEGRGIGLANKLRAYRLQDQGFDTVEANHRLGFEDDERDFRIGAAMLKAMGFSAARLLTNNPAKVAMLQAKGITVIERVPLAVGRTADNESYLATKAKKSGHIL